MISTKTAPHYSWGEGCDGWHLVRTEELSVIQEHMPPVTEEVRHYHEHARQFFYVLAGTATIEVDGVIHRLGVQDGIEIQPGTPHQLKNEGDSDLHFLVISQPPSHGDRILVELPE